LFQDRGHFDWRNETLRRGVPRDEMERLDRLASRQMEATGGWAGDSIAAADSIRALVPLEWRPLWGKITARDGAARYSFLPVLTYPDVLQHEIPPGIDMGSLDAMEVNGNVAVPLGSVHLFYPAQQAEHGSWRFSCPPLGSIVENVGPGDGASTVYVLSQTPTGTPLVYVNGVLQVLGVDYTIVGGTITFTTAPPDGAVISVLYAVGTVGQDKLVACTANDTTPGYLYTDKLASDGGITLALHNPGANEYVGIATAPEVPKWVKVTKTYADFSTASTTNTVTVYTLPAGGVVLAVKVKHSASFTGGAITAYSLNSIGVTGATSKYFAAPFSIFQATGATVGKYCTTSSGPAGLQDIDSQTATTNVIASVSSTGANLSAATAGSVDVWLLVSVAL